MNKIQNEQIAPVVRTVQVSAPPHRAFEVFALGIGRWWPKAHRIGTCAFADIIIEPQIGGRLYERGEDGSECDWGHVIAYEPGEKLVLGWQLNAEWAFDPDFEVEVEVTFTSNGDGTSVRLEHRNLERYGKQVDDVRKSINGEGGWPEILGRYGACCTNELEPGTADRI